MKGEKTLRRIKAIGGDGCYLRLLSSVGMMVWMVGASRISLIRVVGQAGLGGPTSAIESWARVLGQREKMLHEHLDHPRSSSR